MKLSHVFFFQQVLHLLLHFSFLHHPCSFLHNYSVFLFFCPSALPVIFTKELESQTADEGDSVTLNCELSKAGVPLEWRKGELGLCPCAKYEIRQKVHLATLIIHDVDSEDSGSYTCDAGDRRSTAQLAVKGMLLLVV